MSRLKSQSFLFVVLSFLSIPLLAQQQFASLEEALFSGGRLAGDNGPHNISWIDNGDRFSFLESTESGQAIRSYNPKTGEESMIFSDQGVTYPGTEQPFNGPETPVTFYFKAISGQYGGSQEYRIFTTIP